MTYDSPYERASELYTTGIPEKFKVYGYVKVDNPELVEREVHRQLAKYRPNKGREFFKINPEDCLHIIENVSGQKEEIKRKRKIKEEEEKRIYLEKKKVEDAKRKSYDVFNRHREDLGKNKYRLDAVGNANKTYSIIAGIIGVLSGIAFFSGFVGLAIVLFAVALLFWFLEQRTEKELRRRVDQVGSEAEALTRRELGGKFAKWYMSDK